MDELTDFERLIEAINQLATLVHEYYVALVERGFSKKDAILMAIEYQKSVLAMANQKK